MRICVVIDDYLPDSTRVGAKMMHDLCVEFVRRGHEVTVIAPQPYSKDRQVSVIEGVQLRRFPSGPTKNVSRIQRALNEVLLPWRAWRNDREFFQSTKHDLIVYYSPCIFWSPLIRRLKRLWKAPAFLVLRDFFPQWAIDIGMLNEGSLITRYFRACEAASYAQADVIGIQSPNNLKAFRNANPERARLELLYNWADDRPGRNKSSNFRTLLNLEGKVIYFYGGAITKQQDIPNLLRLAEYMLCEPDAHFLILGEGYDLENVRAIVLQKQLINVTIHPTVDQETFRELLAEVDIGLFSLAGCHSTHNFPGKVLGYLVQGLPVLGSVNAGNDLEFVINEAGAGFVAVNGDDEKLRDAALWLLKDASARCSAGKAARMLLASKFSVTSAAKIIESAATSHMEVVQCAL
jgi:O26-antigen biosynthesis N-acetyl-L-fucosamine transferase